ncbi:MAG: GNAT family N-acetyltransferase [Gaiellaceae bacterium]
MLSLLRAADEADAGASDWMEKDLRDHWEGLDLDRDAWLVEIDGRLGGYADFEDRGGGRMLADGYVHPAARGRGVGTRLLRLTEERACERLAGTEGRAYLQNASLAAAEELYEPHGYRSVRRFRKMVISLDGEPSVPATPGVELRPLRLEEAPEVHLVLEEAFADNWEYRPRTFEEYARRTFHREDFDPALCLVAQAGGELAGASLNYWKSEGDWGYIGTIGVRPAWRRRRIGEALMLASFAEFFRRGERRVALGVDAQNETGAARLYERLGMRALWEAVVWEKELRPGV